MERHGLGVDRADALDAERVAAEAGVDRVRRRLEEEALRPAARRGQPAEHARACRLGEVEPGGLARAHALEAHLDGREEAPRLERDHHLELVVLEVRVEGVDARAAAQLLRRVEDGPLRRSVRGGRLGRRRDEAGVRGVPAAVAERPVRRRRAATRQERGEDERTHVVFCALRSWRRALHGTSYRLCRRSSPRAAPAKLCRSQQKLLAASQSLRPPSSSRCPRSSRPRRSRCRRTSPPTRSRASSRRRSTTRC